MSEAGQRSGRYADDCVIRCASEQEAHEARGKVPAGVATSGLSVHPDKTHRGDGRPRGPGFEFRGYRFEAGRRWVRPRRRKTLKDKIRHTTRRSRGVSLAPRIAELKPRRRGGFGYVKHAYQRGFPSIDGLVRCCLRAVLRRHRHKRAGQGNSSQDHRRWPNADFAERGLFTMTAAQALASQSR